MKIPIKYKIQKTGDMEQMASSYTYAHWGETFIRHRLAAFCWMFPNKFLKEVGLLDEKFKTALFEDDDYCLRVERKGFKIVGAEDVFIHHFGNKTVSLMQKEKLDSLFYTNKHIFEEKWGMRWQPHSFRKKG